jgi:hypothetical protein
MIPIIIPFALGGMEAAVLRQSRRDCWSFYAVKTPMLKIRKEADFQQ